MPRDPITPDIRAAITSGDLAALSAADLPEIAGIESFIADSDMAVVLGKAFFWEMHTGNNGQACASCHFHAGTDRRIQNTLHPGGKDEAFFGVDAAAVEHPLFVFDPVRGGAGGPATSWANTTSRSTTRPTRRTAIQPLRSTRMTWWAAKGS